MSEPIKHHWKSLTNPDYIGAYTLMQTGKAVDLTVKILSVSRQIVTGNEGKKEECTVAKLEGHKPFIINATNAKVISSIYGTPFVEDWAGKLITLYVAKVRVAGDTVDALRIRNVQPVIQLPELTPQHPKWNDAKKALTDKNTTMDAIKKSYIVSPENEKLLNG